MKTSAVTALACLLAILVCSSDAFAQRASVSVSPTRLEFDERTRSAELNVVNRGTESRTFRISLKHLKMEEDGRITEASPGEVDVADRFIRFSPRQIELQPGVTQKVRVMARVPSGTAPGEFRSHLEFHALPSSQKREPDSASNSVELRLHVVGAISIPLIVRKGDLDHAVRVEDASLGRTAEGEPALQLKMSRSGTRSAYGDIDVFHRAPGAKRATQIGFVGGIAIYTPNRKRTVGVALQPPDGVDLTEGRLVAVYRDSVERGGDVIARVDVELD